MKHLIFSLLLLTGCSKSLPVKLNDTIEFKCGFYQGCVFTPRELYGSTWLQLYSGLLDCPDFNSVKSTTGIFSNKDLINMCGVIQK